MKDFTTPTFLHHKKLDVTSCNQQPGSNLSYATDQQAPIDNRSHVLTKTYSSQCVYRTGNWTSNDRKRLLGLHLCPWGTLERHRAWIRTTVDCSLPPLTSVIVARPDLDQPIHLPRCWLRSLRRARQYVQGPVLAGSTCLIVGVLNSRDFGHTMWSQPI